MGQRVHFPQDAAPVNPPRLAADDLHGQQPSGDQAPVRVERHHEDPALTEDAVHRQRLAARGEVAERVRDQLVVEELEPAQDVRSRREDEIRARVDQRMREPTLVAAVLSEVLGAVRTC